MQSLSWTVQDENSKSKFMEETMGDFTIEDMLAMQQALQEKYKDKWEPIGPEAGKHKLLWILSRRTETKRLLRMQKSGSISWKKWRMCSCITMTSFCAMGSASKN